MSANVRTGVSTRQIQRLQDRLNLGHYQMVNYRKELSKPVADTTTYYLLKDGSILPFRLWYQADRPNYLLAGSKAGCKGFWERLNSK